MLYQKDILNLTKGNMRDKDRNRFVLSKGHAGLALYWVMCEAGLLAEEEVNSFLQPGCHVGGEPCMRDLPGIEASTGSLGHGISMGVGMAMAQKMDASEAKTYVLIGDGECEEGIVWEAAMSAAAFGLDNITVILDCNQIQKMTTVNNTIGLVNWRDKWESFGWLVKEVDGHDIETLEGVLKDKNKSDKPLIIIANTIKGKGVSIMENNPVWHFKLPNKKEKRIFEKELNIPAREEI